MHLQFDIVGAYLMGNNARPQSIMQDLGITYQHCTPQSINDTFWFWNCKNVPDHLPSYIYPLGAKAMDSIGWGLSEEQAIAIAANEDDETGVL